MKIRNLLPLLFFLCGCGTKDPQFEMPSFEQEVHGRVELLFPEDLPYRVACVVPYESHLLLFGCWPKGRLHVLDKQSGEVLRSVFLGGRGPIDLSNNMCTDFNPRTGEVTMSDFITRRILRFRIDDVMNNLRPAIEKTSDNLCNWSKGVFFLDDDRMLMAHNFSRSSMAAKERFVIYEGDSAVFVYNEFPIKTETNINFRLYQQSHISISPGRDKLVEGTSMNGALLEVFDLASDRIAPRWTKYLIEPRYDHATGRYSEQRLFGFTDVYAAEDCVVTVLGDDKQDKVRSICIFDWEGRPVKRIVLEDDYSVEKACMDESGTIYAVVEDKDAYLYLVRIVETGPAAGYSIPADKIERFTHEEDNSPKPFV